jgi:predicted nucleic-acid-binding Zn-ribbon protein
MKSSKKRKIFDPVDEIAGPQQFNIGGKKIKCPHCGNKVFELKSKLLNTAGLTFLSLDWANRQAATLTCTKCSNIQWFMQQPVVTSQRKW